MISEEILQTKGRIFNIQRYSIHDGPGIRSIVFLKGCPLRCRWCCNPESQNPEVQQMHQNGKTEVVGRDVCVGEILEEILRDAPYYRRSGGGVTLSGGEAFFQPEFTLAILRACHAHGINTAVETTGFTPFLNIEPCLAELDYVLMDIKHINSEKHREFTGRRNELILENAAKIAAAHPRLTIRTPVVPGFNDTEAEIAAIADFTASLPGKPPMHLLPYHRLGEGKYEALGREYALRGVPLLPDETLNTLLKTARLHGVVCQLGG